MYCISCNIIEKMLKIMRIGGTSLYHKIPYNANNKFFFVDFFCKFFLRFLFLCVVKFVEYLNKVFFSMVFFFLFSSCNCIIIIIICFHCKAMNWLFSLVFLHFCFQMSGESKNLAAHVRTLTAHNYLRNILEKIGL